MGEILESTRKRARTEELFTTRHNSGNSHDDERVKEIINRLSSLLKEFPELKFVIDFEHLQEHVETAVVMYVEEKETKKHEAQLLLNYRQETSPLYSLPDEVLSKCLSFVGKGHYGVVGLTSKKLNETYKKEFGRETAYLEMATSVKLANFCLNDLCKCLEEKDEFLKAAAVNGNLGILRAAVKDGYDLFPLVAMKKKTMHEDDSEDDYFNDDADRGAVFDVYHIDEKEEKNSLSSEKVNLSKLVERGHLHVLKYLHEELHYFLGLQRYCYSAIQYGQIEILEWLDRSNVMKISSLHFGYMDNGTLTENGYCEYAIKSGNVDVLDWLQEMGYEITSPDAFADAIRSKSTDMIQYCFDVGLASFYGIDSDIKETNSVEVFRLMFELGFRFWGIRKWCDEYNMENSFEIIKFLRSISVPWDDYIMKDIVANGTLEMIQYAHNDGCPWTTSGAEYEYLLNSHRWSLDKFDYLVENGCIIDYLDYYDLINTLRRKRELVLLQYFVGKNASFDNRLFREILNEWCSNVWTEGLSYLLEKGKDVNNFKSIEEACHKRTNITRIKYFHSLGLPWCLDTSRKNQFLSEIACYNDLKDVQWAHDNGCNGGNLVKYIKEEWEKDGIRHRDQWKQNQHFFEENGMLDKTFLKKRESSHLNSKNVHKLGDAELKSFGSYFSFDDQNLAWFNIDCSFLRALVEHGYTFRSKSEKESITKEAYVKCCNRPGYEDYRKRLALFVSMAVREL